MKATLSSSLRYRKSQASGQHCGSNQTGSGYTHAVFSWLGGVDGRS
jgi:hypothetical protein